ncbi:MULTISPECIES: CcdC protein domain-containing protein [Streptomyces]|uniref:CcdC protein domain-containing protein n=1 Tax=Streptomyces TaxID=1883 RepID=UPI0004AA76DE|nr:MULTISPECIES: CcdC protein domain-containing protein [Streptomyces]
MSSLANLLVIAAVVVLVVGRQMRVQRLDTERRFWLLPLILGALALRDPQIIDHQHTALSGALLAAGVVATLAMGTVWGWTVRIWRAADGNVMVKGTKATLAAWGGMIAVRIGLYAAGSALGVHQAGSSLMLGIAVLLLVRSLVVNWRARTLEPARATAVLH